MSSFDFVTDNILKSNLEITFSHLVDLLVLSKSESYQKTEKELLVSSLIKTIIIQTSSIVEALLFWKLSQYEKTNKVQLPDDWKYLDIKLIYEINTSEQVIAGRRKKEQRKIETVDFKHVIDLCLVNKIFEKALAEDLHRLRVLRNRQHLGGLKSLEQDYTTKEMEFCFGLAKKVKDLVAR